MTTKIETEVYRMQMSGVINTKTMGALFNQLNDVWQAPTWSSMGKYSPASSHARVELDLLRFGIIIENPMIPEYGGRWKMLHYYAAKFFAPVIVVPHLVSHGLKLSIYGISDRKNNDSCELSIALYSWDSLKPKLNFVETKEMVRYQFNNFSSHCDFFRFSNSKIKYIPARIE